ncbi:hypothetical protein D082_33790 [Synechocystis sp. PCC 6714]|nr:hypothetical protein D082_33790 [Synechocystis sp. PCC 6714]
MSWKVLAAVEEAAVREDSKGAREELFSETVVGASAGASTFKAINPEGQLPQTRVVKLAVPITPAIERQTLIPFIDLEVKVKDPKTLD